MTNSKKSRTTAAKKAAETRRQNEEAKAEQEGARESQEESQQDSNLTTPQPDQPAPTEIERQEGGPRKDDSDSEPRRQESETADDAPEQPRVDEGDQPDAQPDQPQEFVDHVVHGGRSFRADVLVDDQYAVEERRQVELAEAREEHNRRIAEPELVKV